MRNALGSIVRGTGSTAASLVAVVVIAAGVPLLWVWVASQIAGTKQEVTPSLALFITTGILVSYWVVLLIGAWMRRYVVDEEEEKGRQRRASWNRSFRDEPIHAGGSDTDPVEVVFVATAVIGIIAFEIWFFFFAGSPLPSQPLF